MQSMVGPSLRLLVVGLNHRTAPLAVRENLAFAPAQVCSALADLTRRFPGTEAVILSTCNRVELYVARPVGTHPSRDALVDLLGRVLQVPVHEFQGHIYHHEDRQVLSGHVDAFVHWFSARDVGPLVKALYDQCHGLARAELAQLYARHPEYDAAQRQELERLAHRLIGKILHAPVSQMTQQSEVTARPMLAAAIKKLFALTESAPLPAPVDGLAPDRSGPAAGPPPEEPHT